jgi:hypothetical protein
METQRVLFRLPKDLYEWLRRAAFESRQSQNEIVVAALTAYRRRAERDSKYE